MPAKPIDVDRPPGSSLLAELNMQLPNVAMYAFLSLCLTLPAARYCWQKLFDHPSVNQSALRMLMLKGLFVVQTVILGALANDMIFQLAFNRKALPKAAAMWMTPASMVAGAVLWATKSGQMMVNHTVQSLSIAAVPAMVLLHTKFSPMPSLTLVINILAVYLVSQLAVYWEDIKHYLHRHHTDFPLKFFGTQALTDDHETPAKAHGHVPSTDYTNPAHISGDSADQLHEEYKDGKGRRGRRSGSRGSKGGSRGSGRRRSTSKGKAKGGGSGKKSPKRSTSRGSGRKSSKKRR